MAFPEEFYIHLEGEQKGPYTFLQLRQLYDRGFIPEETLYWRDGLEQWQPVVDICGPSLRLRTEKVQRKKMVSMIVIGAMAGAAAFFAPLIHVGWKENNEHEFTAESAYWKARGLARDEVRRTHTNIHFDGFDPSFVQLNEKNAGASVSLPCTLFPEAGGSRRTKWQVAMRFEPRMSEWLPVENRELR